MLVRLSMLMCICAAWFNGGSISERNASIQQYVATVYSHCSRGVV